MKRRRISNRIANRKSKDFISGLPDCLVHHILSFLDMTLVVRMSILSKRWLYLCKSLPFMKFNQEDYNQCVEAIGGEPSIEDFIEFVGKVLHIHDGSVLEISVLCVKDNGLNDGGLGPPHRLPTFLFASKALTNLKLNMGEKGVPVFELSDSVHLPCLKTLHLQKLTLRNLGSFISSCPVLETLHIDACLLGELNDFSISALKLTNLRITTLWSPKVHSGPSISLYAPNLEVLLWHGFSYLSTLQLPSLVSGDIMMINHCAFGAPSENPRKKLETQNAQNCLRSCANAKDLSLTDLVVELAMEPESALGSTITTFTNLTMLRMVIFHAVYSIRTLSSLLAKCPNLTRLDLGFLKLPQCQCFDEMKVVLADGEDGNSETMLQPKRVMSHLKTVEIQGSLWNVYELEIVKFLLRNATVLEKMFVSTSQKDKDRCYRYKKKIKGFPRASSCVKIVFR